MEEYEACCSRWLSLALVVRFCQGLSSCCGIDITFRRNILISYTVWLMATRTAKLLPHLWNRPQDIIYVPAFILFGYYFSVMKLYALLTLHEVSVLAFAGYLGTILIHTSDWLGYSCRCRRPVSSHGCRCRRREIRGSQTADPVPRGDAGCVYLVNDSVILRL